MSRADGRYLAWARIAPGPKGRIPVYSRVSQEEADKKARETEAKAKEPERPSQEAGLLGPDDFEPGTFGHFVYQVWVPHVYPTKRATTKRKYGSLLACHILPGLAFQQISEIGYAEMKRYADGLKRADGKGALPNAQKAEAIMRVREILKLYNTLAGARGEKTRTDWALVPAPAKPKKKKRSEKDEDFTQRFLAHCEPHEVGPHFAALFLGLRRGEACGLRWSKIDRKALTITVAEQIQPETGTEIVDTKGDERTIPCPLELLQMIDKLGDLDSEFVFTYPYFGKGRRKPERKPNMTPWPPNQLSKATPAICQRAELPKTGFHELRSHAANNLRRLGMDPWLIMEILGHSEIDTTTIYMDGHAKEKREGIAKLLKTLTNQQTEVEPRLGTTDSTAKPVVNPNLKLGGGGES